MVMYVTVVRLRTSYIAPAPRWHLEMAFNEDQQRVRTGQGAGNFAMERKLALQALTRVVDEERIKRRRKLAGWDDRYLLKATAAI